MTFVQAIFVTGYLSFFITSNATYLKHTWNILLNLHVPLFLNTIWIFPWNAKSFTNFNKSLLFSTFFGFTLHRELPLRGASNLKNNVTLNALVFYFCLRQTIKKIMVFKKLLLIFFPQRFVSPKIESARPGWVSELFHFLSPNMSRWYILHWWSREHHIAWSHLHSKLN